MEYKKTEQSIPELKFDKIQELCTAKKEGLVLIGCGGDLSEWMHGVSDTLVKEKIVNSETDVEFTDLFSEAFSLKTLPDGTPNSGGRIDLVLIFAEKTKLNIGKMAMWRLRFGDASWMSDYVNNYANHFGIEVDSEFEV